MPCYVELSDVSLATPHGRTLFAGLNLRIEREHVALIGRNGVGKSTLLSVLAGLREVDSGRARRCGKVHYLAQSDERSQAMSLGQVRRMALREAQSSGADILLLDEPSEHLDEEAVEWLRSWLSAFPGGAIVASHDRRLLADFRHFFVISETGCRYISGSLAELDAELEREHQASEQRYVRNLTRLAVEEEHTAHVARRKARKKRAGRSRELDRCTPRIRLNAKRGQAQVSHGRLAKLREERMAALRTFTQSSRRALSVNLSLELAVPTLPEPRERDAIIALQEVAARVGERTLFESLNLELGRERIAVVGPNGAGKTTLLEIMLGRRRPEFGIARRDASRIGYIEPGGENWKSDESLLALLGTMGHSSDASAELLVSHKFPLALAGRPLGTLSPGERARAALICLFARSPTVEVLILDEPTFSLDLLGQRALCEALKAWPGGLVIASHDRELLAEIGVERTIRLS